jgi:hypothetical protein
MNAIKEINNILTACGCAPAVIENKNGAAIKVNAPQVNKKGDKK